MGEFIIMANATDPTIYEVLRDISSIIIIPIGIFVLTYFLGTRVLKEYEERKDKNSVKEIVIRELAKVNRVYFEVLDSENDLNNNWKQIEGVGNEILSLEKKVDSNHLNEEEYRQNLNKSKKRLKILKNNLSVMENDLKKQKEKLTYCMQP